MFEHVFAPIRIRDMELKNRIILPAMGTRMAEENGAVTDKLIAYQSKGRMRIEYRGGGSRTYAECTGTFCIHQ
jgi:hypothetical protein